MTNVDLQPSEQPEVNPTDPVPTAKRRSGGCTALLLLLVGVVIIGWLLVRPGVFTIQPIGAIPDGVTLIYHSRNPQMPLFSSPDGLCLEQQGSVSLLCRGMALGAAGELVDRVIVRLPYIRWAYLLSTGGLDFDQ